MKNVALFYFSGTGNTQLVAGMLQSAFVQQGYSVDLLRMEDILKNKTALNLDAYEFIGLGSQVIGYGVPHLVKQFIHVLPEGHQQKTFIFRTAGGVAPINYNASKSMIRALTRKGYDVFYERIFSIGSNWIARFSDPVMQQLYEATHKKVNLMCQELIAGEKRFLETGAGLRIGMGTVAFLSERFFRLTGLDYQVSSACSNCGLCIKNCPSENIYLKNGKIKFKLDCNCCMRCVYNCPKQAIHLRLFKFFEVDGGYQVQKILAQPARPLGANEKKPPFFDGYLQNDL
jgi:ferredoxin/flavodoxin